MVAVVGILSLDYKSISKQKPTLQINTKMSSLGNIISLTFNNHSTYLSNRLPEVPSDNIVIVPT